MNQTELRRLLKKFLDGNCSDDEIEQVHRWFDNISDPSLHLTVSEKNGLMQKMRENLPFHEGIDIDQANKRPPGFSRMMRLGVAASIALFAIASGVLYFKTGSVLQDTEKSGLLAHTRVVENNNGVDEIVTLSDGSRVTLSPGSKIAFAENFEAAKREVQLNGEAFFEVAKDSGRPFYVYANNVTTRVLGTKFTVKESNAHHTVEVVVKTGCVSVYNNPESTSDTLQASTHKGVILMPNQKVLYFIEDDHWVTSLVEDPQPVHDLSSDELVFDNTSMDVIVSQLAKRYEIEIVYDNEQISKCTFTGDVSSLSLFEILNVIGKSISAEYEVRGSRIFITGKGCS